MDFVDSGLLVWEECDVAGVIISGDTDRDWVVCRGLVIFEEVDGILPFFALFAGEFIESGLEMGLVFCWVLVEVMWEVSV